MRNKRTTCRECSSPLEDRSKGTSKASDKSGASLQEFFWPRSLRGSSRCSQVCLSMCRSPSHHRQHRPQCCTQHKQHASSLCANCSKQKPWYPRLRNDAPQKFQKSMSWSLSCAWPRQASMMHNQSMTQQPEKLNQKFRKTNPPQQMPRKLSILPSSSAPCPKNNCRRSHNHSMMQFTKRQTRRSAPPAAHHGQCSQRSALLQCISLVLQQFGCCRAISVRGYA